MALSAESEYHRRWRAANKEHLKEYKERNKERIAADRKRWYEANKDKYANRDPIKLKAACDKYREANRDKTRAASHKWKKNNPDKDKATSARWKEENYSRVLAMNGARRAAVLQRTPSWADAEWLDHAYAVAADMSEKMLEPFHVDHEIPLQGEYVSGLHVYENLQVIPAADNHRKKNRFNPQ